MIYFVVAHIPALRGVFILEAHGVTISYGKNIILKCLDFSAQTGTGSAFLGRNGTGKSTFMKVLSGVKRPDSGSILIDGVSLQKARRSIGFVPQNDILLDDLSTMDNLFFWAASYGVPKSDIINNPLIERLELEGVYKTKAGKLSGGMRKRLCIAASVLHNPGILILDEPFTGIDVVARQEMLDYFLSLKKDGLTLIVTSHDASELTVLCERFFFIASGGIEEIENTKEFRADPKQSIANIVKRGN